MSAGPIRAAREAWKPPIVSTTEKDRICLLHEQRAYCGRRGKGATPHPHLVTCADCHAAVRADEEEAKRNPR